MTSMNRRVIHQPTATVLSGIIGLAIVVVGIGATAPIAAQATMPYDHIHIAVPAPVEAVDWYAKYLNGTRGAATDRVWYGGVIVAFQRGDGRLPSAGTVTDHVALSVARLDDAMKPLQAAGATILEPAHRGPDRLPVATIQDPWGVKLELIEDPQVQGLHHVHLRVPDANEVVQWLHTMFGGEPGKWKGRVPGLRYGSMWVLVDSTGGTPVPLSHGHAIDHIGWRPENLDEKVRELKIKGANVTGEPQQVGAIRYAFVEAPGGIRIELTQRPPQ